MYEILRTGQFDAWLRGLRDKAGRVRIEAQIDRLQMGNAGKAKPVGDGISELRIDAGPGYRVYYVRHGKQVYLLLAGSDKKAQQRTIALAKELARLMRNQKE
jgi:putative addiction module killer protein